MTIRPFRPSDIAILKRWCEESGFPYPNFDDPHIEAFLVVADSEDRPIGACAAKRLIELYGYFDPSQSPATKLAILKALHHGMAECLRALGYTETNAQIPPDIAKVFGNRLRRSFGWVRNTWENWFIRF